MDLAIPKVTFKSSMILFMIGLFGYFCRFSFNLLLAKHTSTAFYGDFSVAYSVFTVVSASMLFGTASSSLRFFSTYLKKDLPDIATKYITWNLRIVIITSVLFLLLLSIMTTTILGLHLFNIHNIREYHLVIYFLWLTPIGALSLLLATYLLCDRNIYLGTFFNTAGFHFFGFMMLIPMIYLLHVHFRSETLWLLLLCIIVTLSIFLSLILFFRMRHILKKSVVQVFKIGNRDKLYEREWLGVSSRLILNQLMFYLITALDIILLGLIGPNKESVGYYAVAITITGITWTTQHCIYQFILPIISSHTDTDSGKRKLQHLINKTQLINIILNMLLIALIIIFTRPILGFFGSEYLAAKIPLWILLATAFIALLSSAAPKLLAYSGNEKSLLQISSLQIITILISGILLIPHFGAIGAALAAFATWVVRTIASLYFVRKRLHMKAAILF